MITAGFGAIQAAIQALDTSLADDCLVQLGGEDLTAYWHAAGDICHAADALYAKLRGALANELARASHQTPPEPAT